MIYANIGSLGTQPGKRDAVVEILTRLNPDLMEAGCLLYEVGTNDDEPDTVFVMELWESLEAHQQSLQLDSVKAAIDEAMPLLSGSLESKDFSVVGSPLRNMPRYFHPRISFSAHRHRRTSVAIFCSPHELALS